MGVAPPESTGPCAATACCATFLSDQRRSTARPLSSLVWFLRWGLLGWGVGVCEVGGHMCVFFSIKARWWFQTPNLGEDEPILTHIFLQLG